MKRAAHYLTRFYGIALLSALVFAGTGCPVVSDEYQLGFDVGFLRDDYYWTGYADSYDTLEYDPVYYSGSEIPYVEDPPYDAGYWDGVWYAYNDGYFVCYDYAFTIGFSEGYDAAFFKDYLDFLASDEHIENDNGGWGDGYNDGFSEGRVFGAADYEADWDPDWLDALEDYRSGTDLCFDEVGVCTGDSGPVILYEYGWDPLSGTKSANLRNNPDRSVTPSIRRGTIQKAFEPPAISYRTLTTEAQNDLNVKPTTTPRSARPLTLSTTWLQRVNQYLAAYESKGAKSATVKAVRPRSTAAAR